MLEIILTATLLTEVYTRYLGVAVCATQEAAEELITSVKNQEPLTQNSEDNCFPVLVKGSGVKKEPVYGPVPLPDGTTVAVYEGAGKYLIVVDTGGKA